MPFLRQSTSQVILFGPCLDKTDGVTEETGLTLAQADMRLSKDGGAFAQKSAAGNATHDSDGWYATTLSTTDTATVGELVFNAHQPANMLPVWMRYWVIEEAIYDAIYGAGATGELLVDVAKISGDSVAADNLESQYDTTGLVGGTFPANQDQVGAIGTSGGAALNFEAADDNVDGALNSVTFVGVQTSGTFVSTEAEDGTNHVIDDDTNNIDIVYQFNIGGGRTATEIIWKGFLNTNNASMNIQMWDFIGEDWETRAVIVGKNQTVNGTIDFPVLSKHTGIGDNLGIVYVRFVIAGGTDQTLETDELIVEAVGIGQSVGYQDGAVWIDTVGGTAGTEAFVNGVADNPVLSLADAITIAAAVGLTRFQVVTGSTITFTESHTQEVWNGDNWTLDLSGEDISDIYVKGAMVSGIGTGSGEQTFIECRLGACTWPAGTHTVSCEWEDTQTLGAAGFFDFDDCSHGTVTGVPTLDFGSGNAASVVHMHPYHGGLEIQNMGAGAGSYFLHLNGAGALTINANCSATATINIAGNWGLTNNASGLTINDEGLVSQPTVNDQMLDVMVTDTHGEPAQGAPGDTLSMEEKISFIYAALINDIDIDSGFKEFRNAGGTVIWKKGLTDDGSNYSEGKGETGP